MSNAYVTLVSGSEYALGALTLARSLRRIGTAAPLVVLVRGEATGLDALESEGCLLRQIDPLPFSQAFRARHARESQHAAAPFLNGTKPAFHDPLDNFCKLRLWELEEYRRVVFLDADTVVLRSIDRLFGYPEGAAAPNLYASLDDFHRMNSGVFVAEPSRRTFEAMLERLDVPGAFWRRTDQTFLESWWPEWHGLPYLYNTLQYVYADLPQLWRWEAIRVLHYQFEKPWQADHPRREALAPLIDVWWRLLDGRPLPERIPARMAPR
jgi:alpha-N-acetylglucosamine transferase